MKLFEAILDFLANSSKGSNKFHKHEGKTGKYWKWGDDSKGRKGKTIIYKKK